MRDECQSEELVKSHERSGADDQPMQQRPAQRDEDRDAGNVELRLRPAPEPEIEDRLRRKARDAQQREAGDTARDRRGACRQRSGNVHSAHAGSDALRVELKEGHGSGCAQYGGCLGAQFDPFVLDDDPNATGFKVRNLSLDASLTPERLTQRIGLLKNLADSQSPQSRRIVSQQAAEMDIFSDKAVSILQSEKTAQAFDLTREPDSVRERYGRHSWGQSHLLARRLVEAGTRFVTTVNSPSITWDTHKDNFNGLKNRLVPPMEQAYAALGYDVRSISYESTDGRPVPLTDGLPLAELF